MINPAHAKFVETHIAPNDIRAFVCEDPDDLEVFMRVMRDEQKLKVNAVKVPPQPVTSFHPNYPIDQLKYDCFPSLSVFVFLFTLPFFFCTLH